MAAPPDWHQRHDALFERWAERARRVYRDGAVDAESYWMASLRIAYLLKEVNVREHEDGWDLCSFLADGERGKTWNMVAYWTYGLLNGLPEWTNVPDANTGFRGEWLRRVAVLNLNKEGGGAVTDPRRLRDVVKRDADLLRDQIRMLDPHVVVCAGTGDVVARFLFDRGQVRALACGTRQVVAEGWPPTVAVPHPQARRRGAVLYGSIIDAARELRFA